MSSTSQIQTAIGHSSDRRNSSRKRSASYLGNLSRRTSEPSKDTVESSNTKTCSAKDARTTKKRVLVEERSLALVNETFVHLVGDLVWARIPGHPWWPSMIAYDPNSAEYFQCDLKSQNGVVTKYHVQFFGEDPLRGWVSQGHIINFFGKEDLIHHSMGSPQESIPEESSSQYAAWALALEHAKKALPLTRQERKLACVFNYQVGSYPSTDIPKKGKKRDFNFTRSNVDKGSASVVLGQTSISNTVGMQDFTDLGLRDNEGHTVNLAASSDDADAIENASDSGIEDAVSLDHPDIPSQTVVEAASANFTESQDSSDMEGSSPKRQQKPEVSKNFDAGTDFDQGFKNRRGFMFQKNSRLHELKDSKKSLGATDLLLQGVQEQSEILKKQVSELEQLQESASEARACRKKSEKPFKRSMLLRKRRPPPSSSASPALLKPEVLPNNAALDGKGVLIESKDIIDSPSTDTELFSASKKVIKQKALPSVKRDISKKHSNCRERPSSSALLPLPTRKLEKDASSTADSLDDDINGDGLWKHKKGLLVCTICELPSIAENLINCAGSCLNSFHLDCIGINKIPQKDFLCDECLTGRHSCLICKDVSTSLKRCSAHNCGKYYHLECVAGLHSEDKKKDPEGKFSCPLHSCRYCTNADDNIQIGSGKLLKCIKCPTAYHSKTCVAAGSARITMQHMICDRHCEPDKKNKHINVNWCFVCSEGGTLMCCDLCPASYHPECTDGVATASDSTWLCDNCKLGRKPRYGDIVWVKFGLYRWWPAKIMYPEEVPERIQRLSHTFGDFPVLFFGSRDYCWLRSSRCFNYQEGDRGGSSRCTATLDNYFKKGLEEAREAYVELRRTRQELADLVVKRKSNKPPPYLKIKQNKAITCVRSMLDPAEWPVCECTAKHPCDSDGECLNRMLFFECNSKTCKAGDRCNNQRMQKQMTVAAEPFKCEERGWGLRALQAIRSGEFVVEYIGELIDEATCEKRIKHYHDQHIQDYYFLTIDKDNIIDAYPRGNLSRFMNHSCDPNCVTQKWTVNGEVRVGLFANRDIAIGEELCFNYNLDCRGNEKKACKCGSKNCSGWIGVPPKTQHSLSEAEKAAEKKKKDKLKRKKRKEKLKKERVVHEDDCFLCGDGGELIICQRGRCPKTYHVDCLKLEGKPRGKWECPWHFCDACGKKSTSLCLLCTNSYCNSHKEGEMIFMQEEGVQICVDHEEDEIRELFLVMEKKKGVAARAAESESDSVGCSGTTSPSEGSVSGEVPAKKRKNSAPMKPRKERGNVAGKAMRHEAEPRPKKKPLAETKSLHGASGGVSESLAKKERKRPSPKTAARKKAVGSSGSSKSAKSSRVKASASAQSKTQPQKKGAH